MSIFDSDGHRMFRGSQRDMQFNKYIITQECNNRMSV